MNIPSTAQIRLSFLGQIGIEVDGQPLPKLPGQKVIALLAYLTCNPGMHTRAHLADLLWDDIPPDRFLANLRSTLNRVPKAIKPFITTTYQTITLDPDIVTPESIDTDVAIWVDAMVFQQLATSLSTLVANTSGENIHELEDRVDILLAMQTHYTGTFLDGLDIIDAPRFSEWQINYRTHLTRLALDGLHRLVDLCLYQGQYADGIAYARRIVEIDSLDEEARYQLMVLLARSGQQQAAIKEYQALVNMLDVELGVPPSLETVTAYERIIARDTSSTGTQATLPTLTQPPLGRQTELAAITHQLQLPDCRLLTITGFGGVGKTYVAIEAAKMIAQSQLFLHGIVYLSLAAVQSPERLPEAIIQAWGHIFSQHRELLPQICDYLKNKEMLIVLDNFEHILEAPELVTKQPSAPQRQVKAQSAVQTISQILRAAPHVKFLVTSRQPLKMQSEHLFFLSGMALPQTQIQQVSAPSDLLQFDAIRLFHQIAVRNHHAFELTAENQDAVCRFCTMAQGSPLAIVLGAAHMDFLTPSELLEECQGSLDVLETEWLDLPERQRSVRAVFEHSWQWLDDTLKQVFLNLMVFHDGFTHKAARQVTGASLSQLKRLHSQSMIQLTDQGRYEIHELLRQFSREKSTSGQQSHVQDQHMRFYLTWLASQTNALCGPQPHKAVSELNGDLNNIRQAWQYAIEQQAIDYLAKSQQALFLCYDILGLTREGLDVFTHAVQALGLSTNLPLVTDIQVDRTGAQKKGAQKYNAQMTAVYGLLLASQGFFQAELGNPQQSIEQSKRAIQYAQILEHDGQEQSYLQAFAYWVWAQGLLTQSKFQLAQTESTQALRYAKKCANAMILSDCLHAQGQSHFHLGEYDAATEIFQQAYAICRRTENRRRELEVLEILGQIELGLGHLPEAGRYFGQALQISDEIHSEVNKHRLYQNLCRVALHTGNYARAETDGQRALQFALDTGIRWMETTNHYHLGLIDMRLGLIGEATYHFEQALQHCREMEARDKQVNCLVNLSVLASDSGNYEHAFTFLAEAEQLAQDVGVDALHGYVCKFMAYAFTQNGQHHEAIDRYQQALSLYAEKPVHRRIETLAELAYVLQQVGELSTALDYLDEVLSYVQPHVETPMETHTENIYQFKDPFAVYLNSYRVQHHRLQRPTS
ncbi:MAG: tetratricopeptide repeat protein, partial [Chloroflexota bacterium]